MTRVEIKATVEKSLHGQIHVVTYDFVMLILLTILSS